MAGIVAMGDLSHEVETLLISLDDGRQDPSDELDQLLQQSIDELHRNARCRDRRKTRDRRPPNWRRKSRL